LLATGVLGALITCLIIYYVQDKKDNNVKIIENSQRKPFLQELGQVAANKHNWLAGFYTCFTNLPMAILAALWGNLYLKSLSLSQEQASSLMVVLFAGMMIGSPLIGYISDSLQRRRSPMICGSVLLTLVTTILALNTSNEMVFLGFLFLILGLCSSIQVLGYTYVTEVNNAEVSSMAIGFSSVILLTLCALYQPFFGWMLTYKNHINSGINSIFMLNNYQFTLFILPISALLSLIIALIFIEPFESMNKMPQ